MNIYLNGQPQHINDKATITDLIEQLNLTGRRIAIELNENIVPRSEHSNTYLKENDSLEIVHAIGGG